MLNSLKKVRLDELGEIITGNTPSKKNKQFYNSKDIPFIKPDDLNEFGIKLLSSSKEYISNVAKSKARMLEKGSILFTCIGIIGKVGIIDCDKAAFNQQINAIIPNNNKINSRYLAYCLYYNRNRIKHIANAPVVPIINKTQFKQIEILIHPNIQVQYKVADILDKAQRLIDKRKKQIKECDRLIESLFYDMFGDPATNPKGWSCRSFKSVARIATISADMDEIGEDDLYVGLEHIEKDTGKILEYVRAKDVDLKSDKFKFNEGMILYGKLRPYLNKVALIKQSGVCSTDILPILPNNDFINIYYLLYYMRDRYFVNSMTQRAIGANLPRVNKRVINSFRIMLPPLELQNEFARKVEKIEHQKQLLEKSLSLMEDNFNSLMQKAFRGELFS